MGFLKDVVLLLIGGALGYWISRQQEKASRKDANRFRALVNSWLRLETPLREVTVILDTIIISFGDDRHEAILAAQRQRLAKLKFPKVDDSAIKTQLKKLHRTLFQEQVGDYKTSDGVHQIRMEVAMIQEEIRRLYKDRLGTLDKKVLESQ